MRAKAMLVAAAVLGVGLGAQATVEPVTAYERVLADIVAAFGFVPPTAEVGGVEIPTEDALSLLRANDARLAASLGADPHAAYLIAREPGAPCNVGAVLTALSLSTNPSDEPMDERLPPVVPTPRLACGLGYGVTAGAGHAEPTPQASRWMACVGPGVRLGVGEAAPTCHDGDFGAFDIAGRIGYAKIRFSWSGLHLTVEQLFGGIPLAGAGDAALVVLEERGG